MYVIEIRVEKKSIKCSSIVVTLNCVTTLTTIISYISACQSKMQEI